MLYSGTDPESYITEYTLVYEDKPSTLNPKQIVVGECQDLVFARELDECTGLVPLNFFFFCITLKPRAE